MRLYHTAKGALIALAFLVGLSACKKDSDLILSPDQLELGSYLRLVSMGNTTLNLTNQSTAVSMVVSGYGEPIDKVGVYVSTNNTTNRSTWRLVKEFPVDASQQATLSVTTAEIQSALGTPLPNGYETTLYNEVTTTSGKTYSLANTNSEFESSPDYFMGMRWAVKAPCDFDQSVFDGEFTIIVDTWEDYDPGTKVDVAPGPGPNQITIWVYPAAAWGGNDQQGVVIDVNPVDNSINIPEQYVGKYGSTVTTMKSSTGSVNSCSKSIVITGITFNYGGSIYPGYSLTLRQL
jgi:hypothetical protein